LKIGGLGDVLVAESDLGINLRFLILNNLRGFSKEMMSFWECLIVSVGSSLLSQIKTFASYERLCLVWRSISRFFENWASCLAYLD